MARAKRKLPAASVLQDGAAAYAPAKASPADLLARYGTKSNAIRALAAQGVTTSEIAKSLDIRYQHVRNVLVASKKDETPSPGSTDRVWISVGPDGRVVIPAAFRKALGLERNGQVLMIVDKGEVRLLGRDAAIRRAQDLVAKYVPAGTNLADELIAERNAEAARDNGGKR